MDFDTHQRRIGASLAKAGWEVRVLEAPLSHAAHRFLLVASRADGRWIRAWQQPGGACYLDSYQRKSWLGHPEGASGNWPLSPQVEDLFLGRAFCKGLGELVALTVAYLLDNATQESGLSAPLLKGLLERVAVPSGPSSAVLKLRQARLQRRAA